MHRKKKSKQNDEIRCTPREALHQSSATFSVTSSPAVLWTRATQIVMVKLLQTWTRWSLISPLCVPSVGPWRRGEGSSEMTLRLCQERCRRRLWSLEQPYLYSDAQSLPSPRITQGQTSCHAFYQKAWKLDFPLPCISPLSVQSRCHISAEKHVLSAFFAVIAGEKTTSLLDMTLSGGVKFKHWFKS